MKIEHFAFNVKEPRKMAEWYIEHLNMSVAKREEEPPYTHFLVDSSGKVMIEVYNNPPDQVPEYRAMNPLLLHLAFVSKNPDQDKNRLLEAGATLVEDTKLSDGSHLVMMRDPWGHALQLCKRAKPMI